MSSPKTFWALAEEWRLGHEADCRCMNCKTRDLCAEQLEALIRELEMVVRVDSGLWTKQQIYRLILGGEAMSKREKLLIALTLAIPLGYVALLAWCVRFRQ